MGLSCLKNTLATLARSVPGTAEASAAGSEAPIAAVFNQIRATSSPAPALISYATTIKHGVPGTRSVASHVTAELLLVETPTLYLPAVELNLVHTVPPKDEVDAA